MSIYDEMTDVDVINDIRSTLKDKLRVILKHKKGMAEGDIVCIAIDRLVKGGTLTDDEAVEVFRKMISGTMDEEDVGALLVLMRPENMEASTIAALARVVMEHSKRVHVKGGPVGDTCGTGGC